MPEILVACLLLLVGLTTATSTDAGVTDDIAPCVVFLQQEVPSGQEAQVGSGFLVRSGETPYLVTAAHVARAVGDQFRIVMPDREGRVTTASASRLPWRESRTADAAASPLNLKGVSEAEVGALLARSLPSNLLSARELPPSRDIPLTVMGYPLGLGSAGYVSPLSIETRAASGFITMKRFDNGQPAEFILLQDPSIGGLSGGPVFDTGKSYFAGGRATVVREGVSVVGLVHGVISDKTGGKFAAVVPATAIVPLLANQEGATK